VTAEERGSWREEAVLWAEVHTSLLAVRRAVCARRAEEVVTGMTGRAHRTEEVTVRRIRTRVAATTTLVALASLLSTLGAPWKW
jgi:hypothetical protein